ncbi:centrosomal protein of 70 kDa isoform X2 [Etheostoma spectabile]|uniref:centrosomal protein of 70 kDa isoform X2 n=1 Tax=Etheostoma spectabile TaxID=54343 RepID=UPI0013AEF95B|nr:centrosomal protein of 70 kDa isoform X2 [Etheostoma spectabile]
MDNRTASFVQSRNNTSYVYVWTSRQFQEQQVEWDNVNKLLQHHGFKPVCFADPVENKNLSDLILLDRKSASEIRRTLKMMLTDSERRQALVQELVKSNNQLKEEAHKHTLGAAQQCERAAELEALLAVVRIRVQDLEDRYLAKAVQQHSHTQQLQRDNQDAQERCQVLEKKLSEQREEVAQLQKKLYFTVKEEEQRLARQGHALQQVCTTASRQNSPAEPQSVKGESGGSHVTHQAKIKNVTPSLRAILKEQQKASAAQIEDLKREVEHLKRELRTRLPQKDNTTESSEDNVTESSEDIALCVHYRHLLDEISAVVNNPNAPLRLHRQKPTVGLELAEFQTLLPTLEDWAQQLHLLKDLQRGLCELKGRLMPWQPPDDGHNAGEALKVEDMMLLVDTMLENTLSGEEKVLQTPTRYTLGSMVSHFQKLFDVRSLSGVFPRMNEVYTRLGEMTNAMRNLRDVLQLDCRVPPSELVNHVSRLVSSTEHAAGLYQLLGEADVDRILVKVKQHQEFFPAFHALITDILHTLGVNHLDAIIPALQSLKQTPQ